MTVPLTSKWHPEQRLDPQLAKDRIQHVGVIDLLDDHWLLVGCDATGKKTLSHPHAHPLTDRRFDPPGSSHHKLLAGGIEQQHRRGADPKKFLHPIKQLTQQVLDVKGVNAASVTDSIRRNWSSSAPDNSLLTTG
jgi:hypothetical protein